MIHIIWIIWIIWFKIIYLDKPNFWLEKTFLGKEKYPRIVTSDIHSFGSKWNWKCWDRWNSESIKWCENEHTENFDITVDIQNDEKLTLLLLSNCLWPLMIWKQLQGEDQAVSMFLLKYAFWTYHEPGIPARDRIVRRPLKPDLERQYRWTFNVDKSIPLQGKFRKIFQPSLLLRTESKLEMMTFYASEKRMIF